MKYFHVNLYILTLTNFLSACSWNQIVPFLPQFLREMNVEQGLESWVGFIFAMNYIGGIVMQPAWGRLGDRIGRKAMVVRAGFCLAVICFGMSFSTTPLQVAFFRFLNGAFTGFAPGAIALIATNTPKELSGRYVAVAQTGTAVGTIAGPAIGGLMATVFGYRETMRISGLVVFIATLLVLLFVKEVNKVQVEERTTFLQDFATAFRMPVLTSVMITVMLSTVISMSIQPMLTFYLETLNPAISQTLSGFIFSIPSLAFIFFAYRWSALGERISYPMIILICLLGVSISTALLSFTGTVLQFVIIYFIVGVFLAGLTPCAAALIATKVDENFRGRAYGMQQSASYIGGTIAPTISGFLGGLLGIRYTFFIMGFGVLGATGFLYLQMRKWVNKGDQSGSITSPGPN